MKKLLLTQVLLAAALLSGCGCDFEGKKQCAWVLEPDPERESPVDEGYVPVCARNRESMKQDCRLQITLELGKKSEGKMFRYVDMKIASPALPRTITSITYCDPTATPPK